MATRYTGVAGIDYDSILKRYLTSFSLTETNVKNNEISSSILASQYPSTTSEINLTFTVRNNLLQNIRSPEELIKALVNDYLHTNFDGLTLKRVEEDYPEYGL